MPRLFALDRNFPQPIVGILSDFQADATLVPLDRIDTRLATLDFIKRFAEHNDRSADDVWTEFKLSAADLARDPLS